MSPRKNVPDLRLLAPVCAGLVGTRLGLSLPGVDAYVLAGAVFVAGIGCLCVPGRYAGTVVLLPIGAALLVGAVLTTAAALRADAVRGGPIAVLAASGAHARIDATVTGDPKIVKNVILIPVRIEELQSQAGDGDRGHDYRVRAKATVLAFARVPQNTAAWTAMLPSMRIRLSGRLATPRDPDSPDTATILANQAPQIIGGPDLLQRLAGSLRADLRRAVAGLPPEPAGVLPALTLGDTSAVPPQTAADLKTAGLSFLTVVSGENLMFVSAAMLPLAKRIGLRARALAFFGALLALGFTALARPGPPMVRATVTALLASTALATGRRFRGLTATAGAALILLLLDPWLANAYGFILSVAATAGLLISAPAWRDRLIIRGVPNPIATAAAFTAAAELYCEPLLVTFTGRLPLLSVPANVLAVPAAPPATVLGVAAMAAEALFPPAGPAAAWLAQWPTRWICLVARMIAGIPGAAVPWPNGAVGCFALLFVYALGVKLCRAMQRNGPLGDLNG
ncbi:ComEC/Rec2 family competence protein [Actinospica robiniae]|uniref:ComEC/Rec2 family competence protein n=1 Tax=Actinospica robiniae TaxID=304901 RepID=UPI0004133131|nr:ComEC/Rec2 family competence protein [Actinospica robiniae]